LVGWLVGWFVGWLVGCLVAVSQSVTLLPQWGRVLPDLTFTQVVNKFPSFYGNQMFMTMFTGAHM
jgi:hypothetical protein